MKLMSKFAFWYIYHRSCISIIKYHLSYTSDTLTNQKYLSRRQFIYFSNRYFCVMTVTRKKPDMFKQARANVSLWEEPHQHARQGLETGQMSSPFGHKCEFSEKQNSYKLVNVRECRHISKFRPL